MLKRGRTGSRREEANEEEARGTEREGEKRGETTQPRRNRKSLSRGSRERTNDATPRGESFEGRKRSRPRLWPLARSILPRHADSRCFHRVPASTVLMASSSIRNLQIRLQVSLRTVRMLPVTTRNGSFAVLARYSIFAGCFPSSEPPPARFETPLTAMYFDIRTRSILLRIPIELWESEKQYTRVLFAPLQLCKTDDVIDRRTDEIVITFENSAATYR